MLYCMITWLQVKTFLIQWSRQLFTSCLQKSSWIIMSTFWLRWRTIISFTLQYNCIRVDRDAETPTITTLNLCNLRLAEGRRADLVHKLREIKPFSYWLLPCATAIWSTGLSSVSLPLCWHHVIAGCSIDNERLPSDCEMILVDEIGYRCVRSTWIDLRKDNLIILLIINNPFCWRSTVLQISSLSSQERIRTVRWFSAPQRKSLFKLRKNRNYIVVIRWLVIAIRRLILWFNSRRNLLRYLQKFELCLKVLLMLLNSYWTHLRNL